MYTFKMQCKCARILYAAVSRYYPSMKDVNVRYIEKIIPH